MTEVHSFFEPDGRVLHQQFIGPLDQLPALLSALPAGTRSIPRALLPDRHRVEVDGAGELVVVEFMPEQPEDDELRTWAWNPDVWRWQSVPTLMALKRERQRVLEAEMAAIDAVRVRPLSEHALGQLDEVGLQKLEDTQAQLIALRARWQAIAAADTLAALDAIT